MLPVVRTAAWDWEPPHMSGCHYPHPPPPHHHSTRPIMLTVHASSRTTKTCSGTPICCCRPPPPPPPHSVPPSATSEPPDIQPKALIGPFTAVAKIKKVRGRLRNQPDRTSSVAAFNAWFVRNRESHVCGPPVSCAKCSALRWPPLHFHRIHKRPPRCRMISPPAERKDLAPVPWRSSRLLCWVFSRCASSSPLEADVLCVACFTRLARPMCRASALPLEERRDLFRVL